MTRGYFGDIWELMFPFEQIDSNELLFTIHLKKNLRMKKIIKEAGSREVVQKLGRFLLDLFSLKDTVILPIGEPEITALAMQVVQSMNTGKPICIFTPFCPDWSRDSRGRYDFKSLGGDIGFIANKFFEEAPAILSMFARNSILYEGYLIFADWGFETEIDAKDTYGRKLSSEDIQICFESTISKTDQELLVLQKGELERVFGSYRIMKMTRLFGERIDSEAVYKKALDFFSSVPRGIKLAEEIHRGNAELNKKRFGLSESENMDLTTRNLAEYATLGYALGNEGIIVAAESNTSTKAYNLFRSYAKLPILPVFFLKGKRGLNYGENIF